MLTAYLSEFNALVQAPSSAIPLISPAQATSYINTARNQVAAEGECIRVPATLTTITGQRAYSFSAIDVDTPASAVDGVIAVRMAFLVLSEGYELLDLRSWEWFAAYYLPSTTLGQPARLAQQGQGANGTLYFSPVPNAADGILFDVAGLPIPLVDDTTSEAIPYPWTDAVPFYAAWLGLQSLQRQADADMIMQRYQVLMRRARDESSPSVLPENLPGDIGAKLAAAKTTLTQATQAPG